MSDRMVERAFELELHRLFAETPALPDADAFARRVAERLNREWAFRRFLIGGLGVAGGVIGGAQILGFGLLGRFSALWEHPGSAGGHLAAARLSAWPWPRGIAGLLASGSTVDGEVLWMSAALALLAAGLFLSRAIREI